MGNDISLASLCIDTTQWIGSIDLKPQPIRSSENLCKFCSRHYSRQGVTNYSSLEITYILYVHLMPETNPHVWAVQKTPAIYFLSKGLTGLIANLFLLSCISFIGAIFHNTFPWRITILYIESTIFQIYSQSQKYTRCDQLDIYR